MLPGGGGGKGGPLLMKGPLVSIGNNGTLTGGRGGGTKPGPVASFSMGRDESGTFKFCFIQRWHIKTSEFCWSRKSTRIRIKSVLPL